MRVEVFPAIKSDQPPVWIVLGEGPRVGVGAMLRGHFTMPP